MATVPGHRASCRPHVCKTPTEAVRPAMHVTGRSRMRVIHGCSRGRARRSHGVRPVAAESYGPVGSGGNGPRESHASPVPRAPTFCFPLHGVGWVPDGPVKTQLSSVRWIRPVLLLAGQRIPRNIQKDLLFPLSCSSMEISRLMNPVSPGRLGRCRPPFPLKEQRSHLGTSLKRRLGASLPGCKRRSDDAEGGPRS